MRYRVKHVTTYRYSEHVALSHNLVHLAPRSTPTQRMLDCSLRVDPNPTNLDRFNDAFGNHQVLFTVQRDHESLRITSLSTVDVQPAPPDPIDPAWETVRDYLATSHDSAALDMAEFCYQSPLVPTGADLAAFANEHFTPGLGLLAATDALTRHIFTAWKYDPTATNLSTPVHEVLAKRAGVCQDFAHLAIAALRSIGLSARYVSGYLETDPAPGSTKLRGADASHAWFQIAVPQYGWIDFDPTNNCRASERHITCAYGRDFGDVTPTRGLILGGGSAKIQVGVDVDALP